MDVRIRYICKGQCEVNNKVIDKKRRDFFFSLLFINFSMYFW